MTMVTKDSTRCVALTEQLCMFALCWLSRRRRLLLLLTTMWMKYWWVWEEKNKITKKWLEKRLWKWQCDQTSNEFSEFVQSINKVNGILSKFICSTFCKQDKIIMISKKNIILLLTVTLFGWFLVSKSDCAWIYESKTYV